MSKTQIFRLGSMGVGRCIENSIIEILTQNTAVSVSPYPDNPSVAEPTPPTCKAFVKYASTKFTPDDLSLHSYEAERMAEITILGSSLREDGGIYDTLSIITKALQGKIVDGIGVLSIVSEAFVEEKNGVWVYVQQWVLKQRMIYDTDDGYSETTYS